MLNRKEILRYLGAGPGDGSLNKMIDRAESSVLQAARPRWTYRRFEINADSTGVTLSHIRWESRDLGAHLSGCDEAFLFACTLGPEIDSLIKRSTITDLAMAPLLQACAAECVEFFADQAQKEMEEYVASRKAYLRPRYSPGYGDFSLSCQQLVFDLLDLPRKIGLTLTDDFLMIPLKSITAVIGISSDPTQCHVGRCMTCASQNCPFRKEIDHE